MSHEELDLAEILHQNGYRMTPQRQIVLDALCAAEGHASPDEVYELVQRQSDAINRATVYRTLKFLQELGVITATALADGHLEYEIGAHEAHHHLYCVNCGADLEIDDALFSELVDALHESYGFQVESTHLTLYGRCEACR